MICRDRKQFWTTQTQFWQWVREGIVTKTGEQPLTGLFSREHKELMVFVEQHGSEFGAPESHARGALVPARGNSRKVSHK